MPSSTAALAEDVGLGRLEDPDELAADDLALLLGVDDPGERVEELLGGVDHVEVGAGGGHEVALDLLGLALAHQPVVDVHAGEPVADRALHEGGGDRRVDAAGEPADRPACRRSGRGSRSTCSSTMLTIVQVGRQPAMSCRKCSSTCWPCSVCSTSGCHCTPASRRSMSSNAATGVPGSRRATSKPGGAAVTASPWDIQTVWSAGRSASRVPARVDRDRRAAVLARRRSARPRRRAPGPSPGSRSRCRRPGRRPREDGRVDARGARRVDRRRAAGEDDRLRARGPASPRPASCAARSRSRRWASRTRRAISWAYWAPKSTTRTRSCSASPVASRRERSLSARCVRAVPGRAPGPGRRGVGPGPGSGLPQQRRAGSPQAREFDGRPDRLNDLPGGLGLDSGDRRGPARPPRASARRREPRSASTLTDDRQPQRAGRRRRARPGRAGRPAPIGWYVDPSAGRGSASPLFGQNAIARSACAVIVSDGFTPRLAEMAEPSATCRPGWP